MRRRAWIVAGAAVGIAFGSALLWPRDAARQVRPASISIELDLDAPGEFSASFLNQVYNVGDCPAIKSHFDTHPIPLHARDGANGMLIVGWQVVCEGKRIAAAGLESADSSRSVVRSFGEIVLYYSWDPALARWK